MFDSDPAWDSEDENATDELASEMEKKGKSGKGRRGKGSSDGPSNVLYFGHLPSTFEEPELIKFLGQFGRVLNVRVSRSPKTGGSRGYAFVEMETPRIAAIVADTMSGYILFGQKRLVCHIVPSDKVHDNLFFKFQKRVVPPPNRSVTRMKAITSRLVSRDRKKRKMLAKKGIDYEFPGYQKVTEEEKPKQRKVSVDGDDAPATKKRSSSVDRTKSKRKSSMDSSKDETSSDKKSKAKEDNAAKKRRKSDDGTAAKAKKTGKRRAST